MTYEAVARSYDERELKARRRARLVEKLKGSVPEIEDAAGEESEPMLRTGEVAILFGVSERCIRNWANDGKLPSARTLGKHRLFPAHQIAEILAQSRNA